ncbi:MAG TPA: hypothetical protein VII99_05610 [Bacteroidia bacterium]
MNGNKKIKNLFFLLLIPAALIVSSFRINAFIHNSTSIAVIISSDNPIAFKDNPTLSVNEAKSFFLRKNKKVWPETNKNILPADRKKSCAEQDVFYSKVLNMSASEVETYFIEKQYQNGEEPPVKFSSDKEVINFVGDEIGAIGYVNVNSLTTEAKTKVKVVLVINN